MCELTYLDLGRSAYGPTLELQENLRERVLRSRSRDGYLLLVEHDPPANPEYVERGPPKPRADPSHGSPRDHRRYPNKRQMFHRH